MESPSEILTAPVERLVFFSDAAVAIALTLLILPLMDGVGDAARANQNTAQYLVENQSALVAFALSFTLIAMFWRSHHRLFTAVEKEAPGLFWMNMGWLLAVVFLPVATANTGSLDVDPIQYVLYIGTMIAIAGMMTAMTALLRRHPECWTAGAEVPLSAIRANLIVTVLFIAALVLSLTVPGLGYWSLLVLLAGKPMTRLWSHRPSQATAS